MPPPQPPASRLDGLVPVVAAALGIGSLLVVLVAIALDPLRAHHDTALYLTTGGLILDGAVPYVDFVELNPPLIMYLSALPVALARLLGAHPIPTFSCAVLALCAASAASAYAQLRAAGRAPTGAAVAALLALYDWYLWTSLDFGQREHLFALAFVPWLLLRWRRWSDADVRAREAVAVGALAGVGACIKPHFLLAALVAEAALFVRGRRLGRYRQPEVAAFAAAAAAYALHFALVPAPMRDAFFGRWVPFIAAGYGAFNNPMSRLVTAPFAVAVAFGLAGAVASARAPAPGASLLRASSAFVLASAASYLAQHKGFQHGIPAYMGAAALAGLLASELDARLAERARGARLAALVVAGALAARAAGDIEAHAPPWRLLDGPLGRRIAAVTRPGDPVLIVTGTVDPASPVLLQIGRRPASRYLWAFPIPMLYGGQRVARYHARASMPPAERRFLDELAEDVARTRPPVVYVATGAPWPWTWACPPGFNIYDYLRDTGFLGAALRDYRPTADLFGLVELTRTGAP